MVFFQDLSQNNARKVAQIWWNYELVFDLRYLVSLGTGTKSFTGSRHQKLVNIAWALF
jgi:hypothetical protein